MLQYLSNYADSSLGLIEKIVGANYRKGVN
jgi:hypothetical protein